jgi:hypothetical protein
MKISPLHVVCLLAIFGTDRVQAEGALQCRGAQKAWVVAELLFGREHISEQRWRRFLATEITPRFPDGLTVFDAKGQWRNPGSTAIARERSKIVMIAMPPDPDNDKRLEAVVEAYKTRFKQRSVGLIVQSACVSF